MLSASRFNVALFPRVQRVKTVLVSGRGIRAVTIAWSLMQENFTEIYILAWGMAGWSAFGLEVEQ